jgi:bacterial/archaeal transporter family-2 protein
MRTYLLMAAWSFVAGAGIPLIGVFNSGTARSLGNPLVATAALFAIATVLSFSLAVTIHGLPHLTQFRTIPSSGYLAGFLIGFYALSATVIIPRFGAASFVAFILIAQLLTSAAVDHFGLFGIAKRAIDAPRLVGLTTIIAGIAIMEMANLWSART